jgi:hypothetical protein
MLTSPTGLRPKKDCADEAQQQLKTTDPNLSSEKASHINKSVQKLKEKEGKLAAGPRWVPDTKTNWSMDRWLSDIFGFGFCFEL